MQPLSVFIITKNSESLLAAAIKSVQKIAAEIVVVDDYSVDSTLEIALKAGAKIYLHKEQGFGAQKSFALAKTNFNWVLELDSDERLTKAVQKEITRLLSKPKIGKAGFYLPYQTFLFEKPLFYGGENYQKLILFNKKLARISKHLIHDRVILKKGKAGVLKSKVLHYSYRSPGQMFAKFTRYAYCDYLEKKQRRETSSLKKIVLYPLHMFWARYIKDKGYLDTPLRIFLDLGFAYMEFLTYFLLFFFP